MPEPKNKISVTDPRKANTLTYLKQGKYNLWSELELASKDWLNSIIYHWKGEYIFFVSL